MTAYPDDPRSFSPDDPDVSGDDPIASHPKRDIIDADYRPEPDESTDDAEATPAHFGDTISELAGKVKQGWGDMTEDEVMEAEGRREVAEEEARLEQRSHE